MQLKHNFKSYSALQSLVQLIEAWALLSLQKSFIKNGQVHMKLAAVIRARLW